MRQGNTVEVTGDRQEMGGADCRGVTCSFISCMEIHKKIHRKSNISNA
jgi:hypothetical protein